jgi:hypothetical protein
VEADDREALQYFAQANKLDPSFEPARLAVMQKTGSAVMPQPAQSSGSGSPALAAQLIDSSAILPTPQSLATIPWKSPLGTETVIQSPPTVETPSATTPAQNSPALLPPVN